MAAGAARCRDTPKASYVLLAAHDCCECAQLADSVQSLALYCRSKTCLLRTSLVKYQVFVSLKKSRIRHHVSEFRETDVLCKT